MSRDELLDIVDENDVIIGQDTRENIHKKGLLHREIHIWFITPKHEIIFQHRTKDKDTYPDLLDATVGGHVDLGLTYDEAALKEMEEETGIKADISDLHLIKKLRRRSEDPVTGKINNTFRPQYAYLFKGKISDLKIEKGKAVGFEAWEIDKLMNLSEAEKKRFIPVNLEDGIAGLFRDCEQLLEKEQASKISP